MAKKVNQHDLFFKRSMQNIEVARDFFKANLPAKILKYVHLETLTLQSVSYIDDKLKSLYSNIVYRVESQHGIGYLAVLVEHQSRAEVHLPFRILEYSVAIMRQHLKQGHDTLPLVYPIVVYHGKTTPYPHSCDILDLFEDRNAARSLLFKPFQLLDLNQIPDEEIKQFGLASIMGLVLKYIFTGDIEPALKLLAKWGAFSQAEKQMLADYLRAMIHYIFNKADTQCNVHAITNLLTHEIPSEEDDIMKIAQQLKQKGMQEGIQKGRLEGIQEGIHNTQHAMVCRMSKMGLSDREIAQYTNLSLDEIDAIKDQ
jgi:predicted transposase/invertase (TIGR01784 family)